MTTLSTLSDTVLSAPLGDEQLCRRLACILGEASAAADAIRELERIRSEGNEAVLLIHKRTWIVRELKLALPKGVPEKLERK